MTKFNKKNSIFFGFQADFVKIGEFNLNENNLGDIFTLDVSNPESPKLKLADGYGTVLKRKLLELTGIFFKTISKT